MSEITFQDLIRHRPLVIAWVWELLCIGAAVYAIVVLGNEPLGMVAIFAGVIPFAVVMILFVLARNKAVAQPDRSRDLVQ